MRILIVGGGGREHALAWRLAQSPLVKEIIASPGNPGIARLATCFPAPFHLRGYADLAEAQKIDLTVVGPEAPLVAGIVDEFQRRGLKVFGPTQAAARLEGSKQFAKEFLRRYGIPTAHSAPNVASLSLPVVVKADGLAAGKGVVIAYTRAEAEEAVHRLGPNPVIEEFLEGEEVSFIGLSNGHSVVPFAPTQDHKRVFDGDQGPNTGGMGAYADSRILTAAQTSEIMDRVMLPAVRQMQRDGTPFTGFLYAGLMMTAAGPKVLEFNVRLGDPETQALMHSYAGDFGELLQTLALEGKTPSPPPTAGCSVCVVLAAAGYPEKPETGAPIYGIDQAEAAGAVVFQAGTKQNGDQLVTNGGRVLGVTASGDTLHTAIATAYRAVENVQFAGMHFRRDIGRKGLSRW